MPNDADRGVESRSDLRNTSEDCAEYLVDHFGVGHKIGWHCLLVSSAHRGSENHGQQVSRATPELKRFDPVRMFETAH